MTSEMPKYRDAKKQFERRYVCECLSITKGNVSAASRLAGKDRKDFYDLMRRVNIRPEEFRK